MLGRVVFEALVRVVEDVLDCVVLLVQLTGVALLLEHGVENFSVLVPQDLHVSIGLHVLCEKSVNGLLQSLDLLVTLLLFGQQVVDFHLHSVKVMYELSHSSVFRLLLDYDLLRWLRRDLDRV